MSDGSDSHRNRSRSPRESPKAERLGDTELRIRGLTRNVTADHVREIMGTFGLLESVDFAVDDEVHLPRGFADVSFKNEEDGRLAKEYMHEGQIDGAQVSVIYRRNAGRANTKKIMPKSPMNRRRRTSPSPVGRRRRTSPSPVGRRRRGSPSPVGRRRRGSPSPVGRRRRSYSPAVYRGGKRRYSSRSPSPRGRSRSPRRSQSYSRSPYSSRSRSRSYGSRSPRRSRSYSRSPYSSRSHSSRSYSSRSYSSRSTSRGRSPPRRR